MESGRHIGKYRILDIIRQLIVRFSYILYEDAKSESTDRRIFKMTAIIFILVAVRHLGFVIEVRHLEIRILNCGHWALVITLACTIEIVL